jgi:hypothetical protein
MFSDFPCHSSRAAYHFHSLLPKQFVNQGWDAYLFELYSRFNASSFAVDCRLENTIGGDGNTRYKKHEINWKGQVLRLKILQLKEHLDPWTKGNLSRRGCSKLPHEQFASPRVHYDTLLLCLSLCQALHPRGQSWSESLGGGL